MNLIEGRVEGGAFIAESCRIPDLAVRDGPVTLGFRAEDADIVDGEAAGHIAAPIYTLEMLGDATMVSIRIAGALVSAKAPKTYRARIGDPVAIRVPHEHVHLFDAGTGERLDG